MIKKIFLQHLILAYVRLGVAGLSPIMPGTCGSIVAVLLAPMLFIPLSMPLRILILICIFWTGSLAATKAEQILQTKDPKQVVIDELLGLWITLLPYKEPSLGLIILSFFLFRIFDIIKLWPVNIVEQYVSKGYGVMLDDVVAALQSLLVIYTLLCLVPVLANIL